METQNIPEKPKTKRGQSKEVLLELSKKGNEIKKKQGVITKYEKQQKRDQIEAKFKIVQEELLKREKQKEQTETQETIPEQSQEPIPEQSQEPIKATKQRKQKVVEVIEEVEESSSEEEEEEVIIKKVIKKVPKKKAPQDKSIQELYQLSNEDMLRRKLFEDTRKRVMTDLFDY